MSSELNFCIQMEVPAQFIIKRNVTYWNMIVNTHDAQTCWESWRGPSLVERERMEWPQPSSGQGDLGDDGGGIYEDPWNACILTRQNDGKIVGWNVCFIPLTTFWSFSIWSCCLPLYTTAATENISLGWIWENRSRTPWRWKETLKIE